MNYQYTPPQSYPNEYYRQPAVKAYLSPADINNPPPSKISNQKSLVSQTVAIDDVQPIVDNAIPWKSNISEYNTKVSTPISFCNSNPIENNSIQQPINKNECKMEVILVSENLPPKPKNSKNTTDIIITGPLRMIQKTKSDKIGENELVTDVKQQVSSEELNPPPSGDTVPGIEEIIK